MTLLPIFATQVSHGGPHTLGLLTGASGVGALISATLLAALKDVHGLLKAIQTALILFGLGLVTFALSHLLWLSRIGTLVSGFGTMQGLAASNTAIQTLVPEEKRGRVISLYTVAFVGMLPFGSLLAGILAHLLGAPGTGPRHRLLSAARRRCLLHSAQGNAVGYADSLRRNRHHATRRNFAKAVQNI